MISATLDSNVWVSSFNFPGKPREIVDLAETDTFEIQTSEPIIGEVLRTLRNKFHWTEEALHEAEADMNESCRKVFPQTSVMAVKDDDDDNKILECALESKSDYIVTGDNHLLKLNSFEGIPIVRPAQFLELMQGKSR